jgi:hypothetical protein
MQTLYPPHSEKKMMNNAEPEINWHVFLNLFKLHCVLHTSKKDVMCVVSCQPMWRLFLKLCHLHIDNYGHIVHKVAFDFKELWTLAGECHLLLILEKERANWILNRKALWRFLQCKGRRLTKRNSSSAFGGNFSENTIAKFEIFELAQHTISNLLSVSWANTWAEQNIC